MPNTPNLFQFLLSIKDIFLPLAALFGSKKTTEEKRLAKLDDEAADARNAYLKGKINEKQLETVLEAIERDRRGGTEEE